MTFDWRNDSYSMMRNKFEVCCSGTSIYVEDQEVVPVFSNLKFDI